MKTKWKTIQEKKTGKSRNDNKIENRKKKNGKERTKK